MKLLRRIVDLFNDRFLKTSIKLLSINSRITSLKIMSLLPPDTVKGMTVLDREKFQKTIRIPVLKLFKINMFDAVRILRKYLLKLDNFKPVQNIDLNDPIYQKLFNVNATNENSEYKLVYLNPKLIEKWTDIDDNDTKALFKIGINEDCFTYHDATLQYSNWKYDEIFKAILPSDDDNVAGFSVIGHILHLNLRDHHLDYKSLIGQVLLDKIKNCTTVVNKTNQIDNTYRNFSMEVLAGDHNFVTRTKENNCIFEFDFSKVYWNPRLCTEHERIIKILKAGDILFDVFAGVGPFAIPASKKKCVVFANDLNPESYKWLNHNANLNKISREKFNTFNKDGRTFINDVFGNFLKADTNEWKNIKENNRIHLTMNLPGMAVEFLDAFNNIITNVSVEEASLCNIPIIIHVYSFALGSNPEAIVKNLVSEKIGYDIESNIIEVVNVRNVAPNKEMMRVSFYLNKKSSDMKLNDTEKRKCSSQDTTEPNVKQIKLCAT